MNQKGYSLIELLVTITIVAILGALLFGPMIRSYRKARNRILWSYYLAELRAEAAMSDTINEEAFMRLLTNNVDTFRKENEKSISALFGRSIR